MHETQVGLLSNFGLRLFRENLSSLLEVRAKAPAHDEHLAVFFGHVVLLGTS
jgi:hypothetical protein